MFRRAVTAICLLLAIAGTGLAQAPSVPQGGTVNGASFRPSKAPGGGVARGSIISIFGSNLASATGLAPGLPLPTDINGTRVTIGGLAARLFFVSAGQINAQVPWNTPTGTTPLIVQTAGGSSTPANVSVVDSAPGLFSQDSSGRGSGAILNFVSQTSTPLNTAASTIGSNGIIIIYGTGFGPVSPTPADGAAATGSERTTVTPVVTVGGRTATVEFSGLAPQFVGLYQINARVPAGTPEGCFLPVSVTFGSAVSNTVTIGVNNNRANCNTAGTGTAAAFQNSSFGFASLSKTTAQFASPPPVPPPPTPDSFDAGFFRFEGTFPTLPGATVFPPVAGGCIVDVYRFDPSSITIPDFSSFRIRILNAGTLTLSGPFSGSPKSIPFSTETGYDTFALGSNGLVPGTWTLSGAGGPDAGAFSATTLTIPSPLPSVTSFGVSGTSFSQSQPLRITWNCPDPNGLVGVVISSNDSENFLVGSIACCLLCRDGQVTVSPEILRQLPPSSPAGAQISTGFSSLPANIRASGIDFGFWGFHIDSNLQRLTLIQ